MKPMIYPARGWLAWLWMLLTAALLVASAGAADEVEVVAEGYAPGEAPGAREQALTAALRQAVEKGAGVNLVSQTRVSDFTLEYDRVFASAFGYVRNYTVTSSGLGQDKFYRVKIRATVGPGLPGMNDELCLRQIVLQKRAPRVALEIAELIEGVPSDAGFAKGWLEETALKLQLNLVDTRLIQYQQDKAAAWDEFAGDPRSAANRRGGFVQNAELIVQAKVHAKYLGRGGRLITPRPDYPSVHQFSLRAHLRVVQPDDGAILAEVALPPREELPSDKEDLSSAAQEQVHKLLAEGGLTNNAPGAWKLFRLLFARWATELDSGALVTVEVYQANSATWGQVIKALQGLGGVFERQRQPKGFSVLQVQTTLDISGLNALISPALGNGFVPDNLTAHRFLYKPVGSGELPRPVAGEPPLGAPATAGPTAPPLPAAEKPLPKPWLLALAAGAGAAVFALISLICYLRRRRREQKARDDFLNSG